MVASIMSMNRSCNTICAFPRLFSFPCVFFLPQLALLLWCQWLFDWLPLNSTANQHTVKGCLAAVWLEKEKKKRICVVVLAFAAIQPALCAMAHHWLCLLLVVVAANWTAFSLLTSHFLLVVFSSWLEMFQIVVTYFGRSRCCTVAVLERRVSAFLIDMQRVGLCNMGAVKLVACLVHF